jgi:predicted dehydrogenase
MKNNKFKKHNTLAVGLIGGGMIAQIAHLPSILKNSKCRLTAIAESRPSVLKALRSQLDDVKFYNSYHELLSDNEIEFVVVSAPREANSKIVSDALRSRKHVFCEKPMAYTYLQAKRLVQTANEHSVEYFVGYMKRFDPAVRMLKTKLERLLVNRELGTLIFANFTNYTSNYGVTIPSHTRPLESRTERFPVWKATPSWLSNDNKISYDWCINSVSHDINLMRFFFEKKISLISASSSHERSIFCQFKHEGEILSLAAARCDTGFWQETIEFIFTNGRITLDICSPMAVDHMSRLTFEKNGEKKVFDIKSKIWHFETQIDAAVDSILHGSKHDATGFKCTDDLLLLEKIWRQIESN